MFPSYEIVKNDYGKFYYPKILSPGNNKVFWDNPQKTATKAKEFALEKIAEMVENPQEMTESESPSEKLADFLTREINLVES